MTTFVDLFHPALGNVHIAVPNDPTALALYESHGWVLSTGGGPDPTPTDLTIGLGDLRYAKLGDLPTIVTGTGVDPTGVADCTAAVQALVTGAGTGATIYWPRGTYRCLVAPLAGQTFIGPGVIKRASTNGVTVAASGVANVSLLGMTIDGGGGTSGDGTGLVHMQSANGLRVEGCRIINAPNSTPAISASGVGATITDNDISDTGYGIVFGTAYGSALISDAVISNNRIKNTHWDSIFVTENIGSVSNQPPLFACKRITITGNTILNCGDSSIEVGFGCDGVTVANNSIDTANSCGIIIRNAQNVAVTGNSIARANGTGILSVALNGSYVSLHNASVTGNTVTNCSFDVNSNGIHLQGDNLTVADNTSTFNEGVGIVLENVTGLSVTGNTASYNGLEGIALGVYQSASVGYGAVSGNTCLNNSNHAGLEGTRDGLIIHYNSRDLLIVGNLATDTRTTKKQRYGLNVFSALTAGTITASGNRFVGNLTGAISDPNTLIAP